MHLEEAGRLTSRAVAALDDLRFEGVPLGQTAEISLFGVLAQESFRSRKYRAFWRLRASPVGMAATAMLRGRLHSGPGPQIPRRDFLFSTHAVERMWAGVYPLAQRLRERSLVVVTGTPPAGVADPGFVIEESAIALEPAAWHQAVAPHLPAFAACADAVARDLGGPEILAVFLVGELLWSSLCILRARRLIEAARPRVVIVAHDHQTTAAALCHLARARGVQSVTLQHGIFAEETMFAVLPLNADRYLAWGRSDADIVLRSTADPSRVHIVGCPRIAPAAVDGQALARKRAALGVPPDRPVALLLATSHEPSNRVLVPLFVRAVAATPPWFGVIRAHPAGDLPRLTALVPAGAPVLPVANDTLTLDESAALAALVASHETSAAFDLLARGAVLVGLDCLPDSLGLVSGLAARYGGAWLARDATALSAALRRAQAGEALAELRAGAQRALADVFAFTGDAAHDEAARVLLHLAPAAGDAAGAHVAAALRVKGTVA